MMPRADETVPHSDRPSRPLEIARPAPLVPRRVLFFGKRKSRSCCTGALVHALRTQGLRVKWVNCSLWKRWLGSLGMRQAVRMIRRSFDPDLCFVFFHDLPHVLMTEIAREIPTVVWIEEPMKLIKSANVDYVRDARLVCLSTPSLAVAYRSLGIANATFLMSGFSPAFHRPAPGPRNMARDVAFIGGPGEMGNRPKFLAWLSQRFDLEIFGRRDSWAPYIKQYPQLRLRGEVRPSGYAEVCASSRIIIGLNQTHDHRLYFSNRTFLTLACQGFHLTRYVPGMETVFCPGEHLDWFHTPEECEAKIEHYLGADADRERIALQGMKLALQQHQYAHRIQHILEILRHEREPYCPVDQVDEVIEIATDASNETAAVLSPRPHAITEWDLRDDASRGRGMGRRTSGAVGS
jgi:spore maturation protein CgeB